MRKQTIWIGIGVLAALVAGGGAYFAFQPKAQIKWRTTKVERGNVAQLISATGTMNPVVQVPVGTQVSGVISALYADYNSLVKKGQLIAQIDPTLSDTQVSDSQGALNKASANATDAKRQYERAKRMSQEQLISAQDLESKEVAYQTALATQKSAKAALDRAKANRRYCDITAPVDGVVISRMADVGQTVAASFSTPNLFQIAQDLSKMKVEISIDEADIDEIKVGQHAKFTVDSLPERQFEATVSQVRLEPVTNNNVVTYKVVIEVENEPLDAPERQKRARRGNRESLEGLSPDQAWEKVKDKVQARHPGMTKEAWLQRRKEREQQEREEAARPAPAPVAAKVPPTMPIKGLSREAAARIPGGVSLLNGPTFSGNLALRPGMTANVSIETREQTDVLKVPNAALRFNPKTFLKDSKKKMDLGQAMTGGGPGLGPGGGRGMFGGGGHGGDRGKTPKDGIVKKRDDRLWTVNAKGELSPIRVRAGISDGQFTEVKGEDLKEGMDVVMGLAGGGKGGAEKEGK